MDLIRIAQGIIAFSFMIFVHELGHFLAARLMGVRVEKFSFGMGPRLFGRKWGQTDYMVSAVPIGGYVRMAGGDEGEASTGATDEFVSKPPGRRAVILAAGPLFSVLFGVPLFMGVYLLGLDVPASQVSDVVIGSPAWKAGVHYGDRVRSLAGQPIGAFDDLRIAALESPANTPLPLVVERGGRELSLSIVRPRKAELGLACAFQGLVAARVVPDSPAAEAGVQAGDLLVSVDGSPLRSWADFRRHILAHANQQVTLGLRRDGQEMTLQATPTARMVKDPGFTIRLPRAIAFVRKGFPADGKLEAGDTIVAVNGAEVTGWWDIEDAVAAGPPQVALTIARGAETVAVELERGEGTHLTDSLGIAPRPVYIITDVHGPTDPQVSPGDVIVAAGDDLAKAIPEGGLLYVPLADILPQFARLGRITVERDGMEVAVSLESREGSVGQLGIERPPAMVLRKRGFAGAIAPALKDTVRAAQLVYTVLRKIAGRDVPSGSLAGPIGIFQILAAVRGGAALCHLVGMITVNIGVLNLLPLPPLDGGRLVFLAYEKLRGKAPNRRVQEIVLIAGVILLGFVLLWATKNDIMRIMQALQRGLL